MSVIRPCHVIISIGLIYVTLQSPQTPHQLSTAPATRTHQSQQAHRCTQTTPRKMSRGGKLAPEVNRYVGARSLHPVMKQALTSDVAQRSLRQEPEVHTHLHPVSRVGIASETAAYIENSYNVTPEELFDLFGKFGPVRYVLSASLRPHPFSRIMARDPAYSAHMLTDM